MESILGPIIDEVTWAEQEEIGILAEPFLRLVSVPRSDAVDNERAYKEIYRLGIVQNKTRNRLIIAEARKLVAEGRTVLIFVTQLEHGENLLQIANDSNLNCVYINGATDGYARNSVKMKFEKKEIDIVIATSIWNEGVNVRSLGSVIVAAGGKSETRLLQSIGRGLRRTSTKDEAIIVDFLDLPKYLASHTVERLQIYSELGLI